MYTRVCRNCSEQFESDKPQKVLCKPCKESIEEARRQQRIERSRIYNAKHKEAINARSREFRRIQRAAVYGMTPEEADKFRNSPTLCKLCQEPFKTDKRSRQIDHCHKTGKVRGVLCYACNTGLGKFRDDPVLLRRAILYIEKEGRI